MKKLMVSGFLSRPCLHPYRLCSPPKAQQLEEHEIVDPDHPEIANIKNKWKAAGEGALHYHDAMFASED